MASQVNNAAWLQWIGNLMGAGSRQIQIARLPPCQFHCLLDELPLHLIPQQEFEFGLRQNLFDQPLFFNPQCWILSAGRVPPELDAHRRLLKDFNLEGTVAWVRDPATGALQPFWLGPRLEAVVSHLRAGKLCPPLFL